MMGTHLHQTLRSLCFNTEWKYAVFWKLQHRARMMLTWEDAYYDNHEQHDSLEIKHFSETMDKLSDGNYLNDPLGLEVAKMSYLVYSLGEGIVGQVAVTGQHQWIFAAKHAANWCPSFETIVVVAVVPHGVVQLGSLNKVTEDLKLVNHIRKMFFALQDSSVGYISNPIQCCLNSSFFVADTSTRSSSPEVFHDCLLNLDNAINKERSTAWSSMFPYIGKHDNGSYIVPQPDIYQEKAVDVINKQVGSRDNDSAQLLQPRSENLRLEHQKQIKLLNSKKCEGETSGCSDAGVVSEQNYTLYPRSVFRENIKPYKLVDSPGLKFADFPLDTHYSDNCDEVQCDRVATHQNVVLHTADRQLQKELENKLEFQTELIPMDSLSKFLKFSAGCELHEALGSTSLKHSMFCNWEVGKIEPETISEIPEELSSSQLTSDCGSDNLLEAVVASACPSVCDIESEKSFCQSMQSLLTTEKLPEPSSHLTHAVGSVGHSIDKPSPIEEDEKQCLTSSEVSGMKSKKGFSSTCPSSCSEQLEKSAEPVRTRKRARPGENCRPRPRDRQLIQDRIKELRELVPNGSKCSIDSLLERTIKHMLFLQSITKHATKLKECAESKLRNKDASMLGSSTYEQGSSWVVEVGNHPKVCPIVVENLNVSGQMLVEMLCEECSHVLEIAEAIRSLGLTILKGVTEAQGKKTWICFVVEGHNNRSIHRMDILWSLVQILQPKTIN
ncbi:transcription factor bHLH155-like isoform X2 [Malania oleifera]|uniref:transcription factor bHLH155-like isoform X2 n=1 Tax=Malania oleifera TaxID=397392 RepID=UPI0025AE09BE|nr:transcription factor bHLH155-like isoform X2 [Malania oleifera]